LVGYLLWYVVGTLVYSKYFIGLAKERRKKTEEQPRDKQKYILKIFIVVVFAIKLI